MMFTAHELVLTANAHFCLLVCLSILRSLPQFSALFALSFRGNDSMTNEPGNNLSPHQIQVQRRLNNAIYTRWADL